MGILINQGRQIGGLSEQDQANIGKVTQTETTTDAEYEILFSGTADNITRTEGVGKSEGMTYNANHKALIMGTRFPDSIIGDYSFSHGSGNTASGEYSHAEGAGTRATGQYSHAEGGGNTASGVYSHAAGGGTIASGDYSHTEGGGTTASGMYSHAEGGGTVAKNAYQHVFGMYNTPDPSANLSDEKGTYIEIVGNGTVSGSTLNTSNARTLDWNGNETLKGNLTVGGTSISVNGHAVAHSGNVGTGDSNGQVKIAGTNVSVKGLGNAAYDNTVSIAHGGTGATDRLNAVKNLFASNVGTETTHFCAIKDGWSKSGYISVANAKTVLGFDEGTKYNGHVVTWNNGKLQSAKFSYGIFPDGIELGMNSASANSYIDFHYNENTSDFTYRLFHRSTDYLDFIGHNSSTWGKLKAAQFAVQSSIHVKENIEDLTDEEALKILKLRPVSFDYIDSYKDRRGLIAEEVLEIYPQMVDVPEGYKEFNPEEPWNTPSIDYSTFIPAIIKLCQIQQKQINAFSEKLDNLNKN